MTLRIWCARITRTSKKRLQLRRSASPTKCFSPFNHQPKLYFITIRVETKNRCKTTHVSYFFVLRPLLPFSPYFDLQSNEFITKIENNDYGVFSEGMACLQILLV